MAPVRSQGRLAAQTRSRNTPLTRSSARPAPSGQSTLSIPALITNTTHATTTLMSAHTRTNTATNASAETTLKPGAQNTAPLPEDYRFEDPLTWRSLNKGLHGGEVCRIMHLAMQDSPQRDACLRRLEATDYMSRRMFCHVGSRHLKAFSSARQDKALLRSKEHFKNTAELLPEEPAHGTAQENFRARKHFGLTWALTDARSGRQAGAETVKAMNAHQKSELVLYRIKINNGEPVHGLQAVRFSQLYPVVTFAHAVTGHKGRDATFSIIDALFSCVRKELIYRYVGHCPACRSRTQGAGDLRNRYTSDDEMDPLGHDDCVLCGHFEKTKTRPPQSTQSSQQSDPTDQFLDDEPAFKEMFREVYSPGIDTGRSAHRTTAHDRSSGLLAGFPSQADPVLPSYTDFSAGLAAGFGQTGALASAPILLPSLISTTNARLLSRPPQPTMPRSTYPSAYPEFVQPSLQTGNTGNFGNSTGQGVYGGFDNYGQGLSDFQQSTSLGSYDSSWQAVPQPYLPSRTTYTYPSQYYPAMSSQSIGASFNQLLPPVTEAHGLPPYPPTGYTPVSSFPASSESFYPPNSSRVVGGSLSAYPQLPVSTSTRSSHNTQTSQNGQPHSSSAYPYSSQENPLY